MSTDPKIHDRSAADLAKRTATLLAGSVPEWNPRDPFGNALVQAFARLCEIVIQRLNQVPDRNFLAFLDMLGASRLPPQPARVPLAFTLAAGSVEDVRLAPGTQAAAPPLESEKEPVIFETEGELWVAAVELASIFAREPRLDAYADYSGVASVEAPAGVPLFSPGTANEHAFYLGHDRLLGFESIQQVRIDFALASPSGGSLQDARELQWEIWDGVRGLSLKPIADGTGGLTRSGAVIFDFRDAGEVVRAELAGRTSRWLRCRLLTPVSGAESARRGMVRAAQLPRILGIVTTVFVDQRGLAPSGASLNQVALDLSKDWLAFGERPRIGDAFHLRHDEAFSWPGALVSLQFKPTAGIVVEASANPRLRWELWNGSAWQELMTSDSKGTLTRADKPIEDRDFSDSTGALTFKNKPSNGPYYTVSFRIDPKDSPQPREVNGIAGYWLRVRLVAGDYGKEARYVTDERVPAGVRLEPATFAPPMISELLLDYGVAASGAPEAITTRNEFLERDAGLPFAPFEAPPGARPELYLGFTLPAGRRRPPNRPLSVYPATVQPRYGERYTPLHPQLSRVSAAPGTPAVHRFWVTNTTAQSTSFAVDVRGTGWDALAAPASVTLQPGEAREIQVTVSVAPSALTDEADEGWVLLAAGQDGRQFDAARLITVASATTAPIPTAALAWEYWNGARWAPLGVRDDSGGFSRPGTFAFLLPPDAAEHDEFGLKRYWVRALWTRGEFSFAPVVRRMVPNTTMAAQTVTAANEILGSSDGSARQRFRTTRAPVLAGPELDVREPELPPQQEQDALRSALGEDAVQIVRDSTGRPRDIWVRWQQVPDFYESRPRDRHYILDHITGEVQFSDGAHGMIPPRGRANVRMRRYRTGGTARGNVAANKITQLKTTVPYVERVTNPEAAGGGAGAESLEALRERVPREIRHRDRAVTQEDYEDLALRATPEVARAKCVALRDLDEDALGLETRLGEVSVIVVPRSTDAKPLPSAELLARVRDYLAQRADVTADVSSVGPTYVRVNVDVDIVVESLEAARTVDDAVREKLRAFLHPLTGGLDGRGWDFGREPYRSDFHSLIHAIPGVHHIRSLRVEEIEDLPGAKAAGRYLVYSGEHRVGLSVPAQA